MATWCRSSILIIYSVLGRLLLWPERLRIALDARPDVPPYLLTLHAVRQYFEHRHEQDDDGFWLNHRNPVTQGTVVP